MPAEGTRKRGNTWYFYHSAPHPDTGKPRRVEARAVDHGQPNSEQGAVRARRAALKRLDDGLRPSGRTVAQLVTRYIDERPDLKPRSRYVYTLVLDNQIAPHLGDTLARDLSPGDVRGWHVKLARAKYAPRTIQLAHALLSGALGMEQRDERLARNVAALVTPPGAPPRADPTAWDEATIVRFVEAAAGDLHDGALWTLLILTGLRIGEALSLTWAHVDLERATLSVRGTRTTDEHGHPMIGPPKSLNSRRDILLPPDAVAQLRAQRDRASFKRGSHFGGNNITSKVPAPTARIFRCGADTARDNLRAFCRLHNFGQHVTPHDLRHVHISWLTASRLDPLAIMARVGHANVSMLNQYSHLAPGSAAALNDAISARLEAARTEPDERAKRPGQ